MATPIPQNRAELSTYWAAAATGGRVVHIQGGEAARAAGIASNSRAVVPGSCFVALRGEAQDGHGFVGQAIEAGAAIVVVERGRGPSSGADVVEVDDTLVAWSQLAKAHVCRWRRETRGKVVAVTGSAGKTTTKELCAALLRGARGRCHATAGNLNNRVGVPAVAFGLEQAHAFAVFEIGMSVPGEIAALVPVVEPDAAIITDVGLAHAEGVGGTRGDIAHEKGALFAGLRPGSVAVANADDDAVMGQLARCPAETVRTFGHERGDYRLLSRTTLGARGSHLRFVRPRGAGSEEIEADLGLVGDVAAIDFLAALAAADAVSGEPVRAEAVRTVLSQHAAVAGRSAVRELADGTVIIDDTYNANPASMRAALRLIADLGADRRRVVILGEMKELGPLAQREHETLGDAIAAAKVSLAIGCGGLVDLALARAEALGVTVVRAASADEARVQALDRVRPGDVVLVKGSRSVGTERVVEALIAARGAGGA